MAVKFFSFGGLGDTVGVFDSNSDTGLPGGLGDPIGGRVISADGIVVISDFNEEDDRDLAAPIIPEANNGLVSDFEVTTEPQFSVVETRESSPGSFNTLFTAFKFEAIPHYNYYIEDEETNDDEPRGNKKVEDIPRYIKLKWQRAPFTDKPPSSRISPPTDKRTRSFSLRVNKPIRSDIKRGIRFDRLSAMKFGVIRKAVANGFICPGVISAIVEMPLTKAGYSTVGPTARVDEMEYLCSESTNGIELHDIQTNINSDNGIIRASKTSVGVMSKKAKSIKGDLYDGKFSIVKTSSPTRSIFSAHDAPAAITIQGILPSSPLMTMRLVTAEKSSQSVGTFGTQEEDPLIHIIYETVAAPRRVTDMTAFTEVVFVDPAITGLVSEGKVDLIEYPEHAEVIAGLGQFLPNLCVLSETEPEIKKKSNIPTFPATQEESGTEYVGYVIEKYTQGSDGVFQLIDEIEIPDIDCTEFIDTKVLYGGIYRYRIKIILKWTRKGNITHMGFEDGNFFDADFTQTKGLATHKSSYFTSEWGRNWRYGAIVDTKLPGPPDEFSVRTESHRKRVVVTWKLPCNSQRDIHYYRLFRKLQDGAGNDLTDWDLIDIRFGAQNVLFFDNDVKYFQDGNLKYVYAAQTVTRHDEFSFLSCQLAVRLNEQFKNEGEYPIESISAAGVRLEAIGAFATNPPARIFRETTFQDTLIMTSRPGTNNRVFSDTTYCLRMESLDTGEKQDILVTMVFDNLKPEITKREKTVHIQVDKPKLDDKNIRDFLDQAISTGVTGIVEDPRADRGRHKGLYATQLFGKL